MLLSNNNKLTIALLILLLAAVLFAGTLIKDAPIKEQINSTKATPESQTDPLTHSNKELEIERITHDFKTLEPEQAYAAFKERNLNQEVYVQHEYAHIFGKQLYDSVGIPGVAICDNTFAFGCYHSFFGNALMENGLDIIFKLEEACIEAYGKKGLGCQHGIGHGVLAEVGTEQLDKALEACDQLEWRGPVGGCTSGVFMEYNFNTMNNVGARTLDTEKPYYPCTELSEQFSEGCYYELAQFWVAAERAKSSDAAAAYKFSAEYCSAVADTEDKIACYRGLGNIVGGTLAYTIEEIKDLCSQTNDAVGRTHCIEGAAWLISWEPKYKDTWKDLCNDLDEHSKQICLGSKNMI